MYKLILFLLAVVVVMSLQAVQMDREMAVHTLFRAKHAVNRAAHAGAQQIDKSKLALGIYAIREEEAEAEARRYLQANLMLDEELVPVSAAFLDSEVEWLVFDIVDEGQAFPYQYENEDYGFNATLYRPGVVLMVRVEYPCSFALLSPISWVVKGVAELTV